jgi:hypothetical protein
MENYMLRRKYGVEEVLGKDRWCVITCVEHELLVNRD